MSGPSVESARVTLKRVALSVVSRILKFIFGARGGASCRGRCNRAQAHHRVTLTTLHLGSALRRISEAKTAARTRTRTITLTTQTPLRNR